MIEGGTMEREFSTDDREEKVSADTLMDDAAPIEPEIDELEDGGELLATEDAEPEDKEEADPELERVQKSSDPIALYLREIGSVPPLTPGQEVSPGEGIEEGERQVVTAGRFAPGGFPA